MIRYPAAIFCIAMTLCTTVNASEVDDEIKALKARIEKLESGNEEVDANKGNFVEFGGAARFQYSYEDYNSKNEDRGGDMDFDVFRLDIDGSFEEMIFSAQYRWYQYMNVVQHAWVGYNFTEQQQGKIGVTQVPFGILTWASNSFFFSSNFYLGLEDDYDLGLNYTYKSDKNRFDLAFFKNDELGGLDGYVSDRTDSYSYNIVGVRLPGEDIYDAPSAGYAAGETNTVNVRYTHDFIFDDLSLELGGSLQAGQLAIENGTDGKNMAGAFHGVINYDRWNVKLQFTEYQFDVDGMDTERMVVAAYGFYDTIAAEATSYMANVAYSLPVNIGPISNLTFYNDYSLITNKSANLDDTFMNVTGITITAGDLYTYVDFVVAENQPFIGGSMAGDGGVNKRVNINLGYYF